MTRKNARSKTRIAPGFAACIACAAIILLSPHAAHAQTTLHKDGFSNVPAQYIVLDNLDVSKATLNTSNPAFAKANVKNAFGDGLTYPSIVWSIPKDGATSVTSPFSIRFPNAGYDTTDGSRVDLVLSCVRLETKILNNRTAGATNICIIYNCAPIGATNHEGVFLSNVTKSGEGIIYALRQTYDVRIYKTGTTTTTSHPLLCYVTDLDTPDATGSTNSYSGAYAEGINLISGYGSDTYIASNTLIVPENSNMRFHGSDYDEETEKSAVAFTLNAAGGRIAWTAGNAGCATLLFRSYVKQIQASSGTGGAMTASGTNTRIAPGESVTENVGWRTNKTYTITPSTGYKIASIKVDGKAIAITDSAKQTYTFSNVKANHTIAATYAPITYKIAFNGNGATSGSTATMSNLKGNTAYKLTANGFKRTGYTFTEWNTKADGSGTGYANSAQVKNLTTVDGGTVTLYAQWAPNKLTVNYRANGATYDSLAGAEVVNQLLRTTTYNYDGKNLATYGVPNANRGTWCLVKPGHHATENWLVGSATSTTKINADTGYPTIQDFASACGVSLATGNATINLYAEFAPDPIPKRTVIVRIPTEDYERGLSSGYGTPRFIATHTSDSSSVRCLVDFANCSQADGYYRATCTVQAPADATCTLANSTRFSVVDTQVNGNTTVFTLALSGLTGQAANASAVNHVEVADDTAPVALVEQVAEEQVDTEQDNAAQVDTVQDTAEQTIPDQADTEQDESGQTDPVREHGTLERTLASGSIVNDAIPDGVLHIVFSDSPVPEDATPIDLSAQGDGSVFGYYRQADATFVITSGTSGEPILANADCSRMFEGCTELETVDTDNLDLSPARDLSFLFAGCRHLASIDASAWDIREAESTTAMFQACTALEELRVGDRWSLSLDQHESAAFPVAMSDTQVVYQAGETIPVGKSTYTALPSAPEGGTDAQSSNAQDDADQLLAIGESGSLEGPPSWIDGLDTPTAADESPMMPEQSTDQSLWGETPEGPSGDADEANLGSQAAPVSNVQEGCPSR